jgi:ABC-2 type transport system ATP-binding protein
MLDQEPAVIVKDLYKTFKLPHEQHSGFKQLIINVFKRVRGYETQHVLEDVSFEIKKGEFFGIVGRNGSGKSTLLKILAGIYVPNKGSVVINGSLTPFIELGVGFNPELTGRENVYLNGALLGFSRSEIDDMYKSIVDFAEIEQFMDQKLKNYSSGMQVRLAFSIAIRARSDILLIDEVLAVGDAAFQKKCYNYFMKLKRDKQTVILVTHDMSAVRQYCDRAIMIENGKIVKSGKTEKVAQAYQRMFNDEVVKKDGSSSIDSDNRWGTGKILAQNPKITVADEIITINSKYIAQQDVDAPVFGFNIYNSKGMNILEGNTIREKIKTKALSDGESISMQWEFPNILATDTYAISITCCNESVTEFYDWYNGASTFSVQKTGNTAGLVDPGLKVSKIVYEQEGRK